ncbi:helicase associated domain-containing protein [Streptomyces canus]|uniref:helicase associated domain-containing protein n=1 Tax=Streptomyces canus TaxID=58343 RepID=UPI002E2F3CFB|nr:helicase associated domain-containing protein [Streptomyces canus]
MRELVAGEEGRVEVLPGFTVHGMDIGKWLAKQQTPKVWQALAAGQRERLEQLGITPLAPEPETPAKPSTTPRSACEKGVAALRPARALKVPRGHTERLEDGTEVRLGVWVMNQKGRREKLTADKLQQLSALGLDWAS